MTFTEKKTGTQNNSEDTGHPVYMVLGLVNQKKLLVSVLRLLQGKETQEDLAVSLYWRHGSGSVGRPRQQELRRQGPHKKQFIDMQTVPYSIPAREEWHKLVGFPGPSVVIRISTAPGQIPPPLDSWFFTNKLWTDSRRFESINPNKTTINYCHYSLLLPPTMLYSWWPHFPDKVCPIHFSPTKKKNCNFLPGENKRDLR